MNTSLVKLVGGLTLAAALTVPALAGAQENAAFLEEAIQGDVAEIRMGMLAEQKAQSEAVREFGRTLVTDHERALEQAQALAEQQGVEPPEEPTAEAQHHYQALSQLSGSEFDREFVDHMIEAHRMAIDKYRRQARSGESEVADLAERTLPTLEKHLETAQSLPRG